MIRLFAIVVLCLVSAMVHAQDYPSFVTSKEDEPTTETQTSVQAPVTEEFIEPLSPPVEEPEPVAFAPLDPPRVLIGDLASTQTWTSIRARIEPGMENLRLGFLTGEGPEQVRATASAVIVDLDGLAQMAPVQAPNQADSVAWYVERLTRQLELFVADYVSGNSDRLEFGDRLIRRTMNEFGQVLIRSDLEREGRPEEGGGALPAQWNAGQLDLPEFAAALPSWPTRRLLTEYRQRMQYFQEVIRERREEDASLTAALEMSELARELASRSYEFPITSRAPFRNQSLQLDVSAEVLHDHLRAGRRLHARRQLLSINWALRDLEPFFAAQQGLRRAAPTGEN